MLILSFMCNSGLIKLHNNCRFWKTKRCAWKLNIVPVLILIYDFYLGCGSLLIETSEITLFKFRIVYIHIYNISFTFNLFNFSLDEFREELLVICLIIGTYIYIFKLEKKCEQFENIPNTIIYSTPKKSGELRWCTYFKYE